MGQNRGVQSQHHEPSGATEPQDAAAEAANPSNQRQDNQCRDVDNSWSSPGQMARERGIRLRVQKKAGLRVQRGRREAGLRVAKGWCSKVQTGGGVPKFKGRGFPKFKKRVYYKVQKSGVFQSSKKWSVSKGCDSEFKKESVSEVKRREVRTGMSDVVRGWYIAMGQYSSLCEGTSVLTLGSIDIRDGVESGREEVNDGEKQEKDRTKRQTTNAQAHIMDGMKME